MYRYWQEYTNTVTGRSTQEYPARFLLCCSSAADSLPPPALLGYSFSVRAIRSVALLRTGYYQRREYCKKPTPAVPSAAAPSVFHAWRCAACSAALRELPATPRRRRRPPRTRAARPHESMRRARPPPRLHRHGLGLSLLTPCLNLRRDWGTPLPHLRRDWGTPLSTSAPGPNGLTALSLAALGPGSPHPSHICVGTKWAYRRRHSLHFAVRTGALTDTRCSRALTRCSRGAQGVLTRCSRGAQGYSRGTHAVLKGYSRGTHAVLTGYSRG